MHRKHTKVFNQLQDNYTIKSAKSQAMNKPKALYDPRKHNQQIVPKIQVIKQKLKIRYKI